jgi:hypothetical protein
MLNSVQEARDNQYYYEDRPAQSMTSNNYLLQNKMQCGWEVMPFLYGT